ncbi:MAG: hypothetical protein JSW59_05305 [Phycisphaerales bacterium]|nr:MAG: hypothetical protein JSW59_05305 [Phycisphaerales bacterium]
MVFVEDFDGDRDGLTHVVLFNNRCYLYRNLGSDESGGWTLADAVTLQAGCNDIELFNPCFDVADMDSDGDWDMFGAPPGGIRRGDRAGMPWRRLVGANPQTDENLLGILVCFESNHWY